MENVQTWPIALIAAMTTISVTLVPYLLRRREPNTEPAGAVTPLVLGQLDARIATNERSIEAHERRLGRYDERLTHHDERLAALAQDIIEIRRGE